MSMINQAVSGFKYEVELAGSVFTLSFSWNTRFMFWSVSLYDDSGNALYEGRKMVLGQPIFINVTVDGMPESFLIPIDTTGTVLRIARGDLGNAVNVYAAV